MNTYGFWQLIEAARQQAPDPDDGADVVRRATSRLATHPAEEIVATQQVLWDLMADSCTDALWAAAYVINGGCSDDGFDYFRGWLIAQGREAFERATADPDALAELSAVRTAAAAERPLECGEMLTVAWDAHDIATGAHIPDDAFTIRYPEPDPAWNFDFDDRGEMARRLPRLTALYSS
ncbi:MULTISPECIES: DUF4240 domain-containing protein [Streptomyces]|uniref:DUF4240 domain-containing protein n=1 Tax=Streptomyces edwardsiae TaxID=3075527 RepID=A0ABU2QMJ9_9ACTN|nr:MULTISPECIES: DUF4240 domain-containing protein [unclassified Streptomyces]MDT0405079.1 DUF4240 domain-containing protein [Streptomyces sp. DSM 41635]